MRVLSSLLVAVACMAPVAHAAVEVGKPAPDFTLTDSSGKQHKLSDYKGKYVVLEWTSTKCPYVVDHYERKTMTDLAAKFAGKPVVWLAIDSSHFANAKESEEWRKRFAVSYPILLDPKGEVGRNYDARRTPHMFLIDDKGVVRYDGAIDDDPSDSKAKKVNYVSEGLTALLAGKPVANSKNEPYGCTVKYK